MKLLEVPLRDIIEAPISQRVRDLNQEFVRALAESFKAGSDQQTPIPVYMTNGKAHAIGGNHQLAAMKVAFGEDSDRPTTVRILSFEKQDQARLEAAKDNNHRDMTLPEWRGIFLLAKSVFGTQDKIARFFGVTQGFVSQALNAPSFIEHRKEREKASAVLPVNIPESDNKSVLPPPQLGGPAAPPTFSSDRLAPVVPAKGAVIPVPSQRVEPLEVPVPIRVAPPPEKAVREHAEALQAALRSQEWKDASAAAKRVAASVLASLDGTVFDWRYATEFGAWTENGPKAQPQAFKFRVMDEVRLATEDNGHRAWIIAHLPGGKVKLRVMRGKEKSEEIHFERDILIAARSEKA